MKYLSGFNEKLSHLRHDKNLSHEDIAAFANVEVAVAKAWENLSAEQRVYPTLDNVIDLCLSMSLSLDQLLNVAEEQTGVQLELPGLRLVEEGDLSQSLDSLQYEIDKWIPTEEEVELLKRFRNSDDENRKLILQLMTQ